MATEIEAADARHPATKKAPDPASLPPQNTTRTVWKSLAPIATGIVILLIPAPAGLKFTAWCYFALFCAVLVGVIVEPIPAAAVGLLGVGLATIFGLVDSKPSEAVKWALAGFSNTTVWLIFAAFMFAMGYEKTGLGRRIALVLVKLLGAKTLGLGYAIALSDFVLSPVTPSNTARSAGIIFPIIQNIPPLYGSSPGESSRKVGGYIMWVALCATCITGSMFTTSLATNLLTVELARKIANVDISWTQWFVGFLPVGLLLLGSMPYLAYKIYPPEIKVSGEVPQWAAQQLAKIGKISLSEIGLAVLVTTALAFWIFGRNIADPTTVALIAVGVMVVARIVTWDDVLSNKTAWNIFLWFATLVSMADGLARVGFVEWFAKLASSQLLGFPPIMTMAVLVGLYYFIHYFFANLTAHAVAVMPVMLAVGTAIPGIPIRTFAMLLCFSLAIQGIITPYACGPAPVYYASGYIPRGQYWYLGLIFGCLFIATLLAIGIPYLLFING
jgi:L-tartrate/succinate antiporter